MAAKPFQDEYSAYPSAVPALASLHQAEPHSKPVPKPTQEIHTAFGDASRRLSIYAPNSVFGLIDELAHLSRRAIEPNVFFDPQFLAPAMPRLEDRQVRLMVMRDEMGEHSRLRLLMPFSVERSGFLGSVPTIRAWAHPFGRVGTLLLDGDDPNETLVSFLTALVRADLDLPDVLVLPDIRADGAMKGRLEEVAEKLGLPMLSIDATDRACLTKVDGSEFGGESSPRGKVSREVRRLRRILDAEGAVSFQVATEPDDVRLALEDFLILEAKGWKGRERSALIRDRYRAAFAREAVNALALDGRVRIFMLKVDEEVAASLVVFVDRGEAYAWKTAYDERFAKASPGQQVVHLATEALLRDPAVERADSCAMPDHFVMNRFWKERLRVATLVIGLTPTSGKHAEAAARGIIQTRRSRNYARLLRERLKGMIAFS